MVYYILMLLYKEFFVKLLKYVDKLYLKNIKKEGLVLIF